MVLTEVQMDNHKQLLPVLPTILLIGFCSCDPEDIDDPIDEFEMIDPSETYEIDEIEANEPETAEVSVDPLKADFNGDGVADLAVGVPFDSASGVRSGSVNVIYGTRDEGLATDTVDGDGEPDQIWHHGNTAVAAAVANAGDEFGHALAAGNFNGDAFADLAIGAPGDSIGAGPAGSGSITILYGSAAGLTATGAQVFNQTTAAGGTAEADDHFGYALATGDFDNDTFDDLAIGVPDEGTGLSNHGVVNVMYGPFTGAPVTQTFEQGTTLTDETREADDRVGAALAAGDFDGNLSDDLAIGVPDENRAATDDGLVHVVYGVATTGLTGAQEIWHQDSTNVDNSSEADDEFGSALAAGDFDNNGADDLAIGVPFEDLSGEDETGAVNVIYGEDAGAVGLTTADDDDQFWHQDVDDIEGENEDEDYFGAALAAGNFDGDDGDDLAIGSPGEDFGSDDEDAGAVNVIYSNGTPSGLSASGDQRWNQDSSGILDAAEENDAFGSALSTGDFDDNGRTDLAIGVPFEGLTSPTVSDAGAVNVLYSDSGGLDDEDDQLWHQNRPDVEGTAEADEHFGAALSESRDITEISGISPF